MARERQEHMTDTPTSVISDEVECPWCSAEPGEPCTEGSSRPPYVRFLPHGMGHLARTRPAGPSEGDVLRPTGQD